MELETATPNLSCVSDQPTAPNLEAQTKRCPTIMTVEKPQTVADDNNQTTLKEPARNHWQSSRAVFGSTFLTIFLAEFGDKTQLSTLLMSAESQSPWVVFLGSAAALITTSLLGVLLGQWLATRLAPKTLKTAAGVCLLFVSVMLLWDVVQF